MNYLSLGIFSAELVIQFHLNMKFLKDSEWKKDITKGFLFCLFLLKKKKVSFYHRQDKIFEKKVV